MDLALDAEISTRHLSFLETGRASPSREMVLRLADQLDVPLRDRNLMLLAAGFAPAFGERSLDDPAMAGARKAIELVLTAHEPWPALVVDRHWNLVMANAGVAALMTDVAPALLGPQANVLRLALHPDGLRPRIVNFAEWRHHLLERLRRQTEAVEDRILHDLLAELQTYPPPPNSDAAPASLGGVAVPLRLMAGARILSFISTTTVFGTALDVTLAELTLETFLPSDAETAAALHT